MIVELSSLKAHRERSCTRPVWLVAHSNVAVKNIAEKLSNVEFFAFRLLVSKEFEDWHEDLYERVQANIIRSDTFPETALEAERKLGDANVVLCTLSMLSNHRMRVFSRIRRMETVIVDEASQIEIGDYVPLLHDFGSALAKLVFIGDDKQYRMPHVIGRFISEHVYKGRLRTVHNVNDPLACRFIDVYKGQEKRSGLSWEAGDPNEEEANAVVRIAQRYHKEGKSYRVISPYDAFRSQAEQKLKDACLPWEDVCFNVDSFQGNEADHIVVCLVRTEKVGFARDLRRSNVMLSRCKRSMVICTSRRFTNGVGKDTLAGKLVEGLGKKAWVDWTDFLNGRW
ncbi:P-loop containing nucleoside triphosphate hydrolase protein [Vararia minispora EC-137]|uniref:P-loop containing nucleoside triphosphate hydrolase protein n=1 Tax=Vararia minispora EC-137 TaxID=1314806 RepID=A0ACB8QZY5_9AGAM|nr:P-loop containing nucleoside triphosphate hydrolase protein [Vararia minispora EC-137]